MRFTLDPGGDVDVPDGATLGRCRPALARLTGAGELTDAVLTVDGTPLPDDPGPATSSLWPRLRRSQLTKWRPN